MHQPILLDIFRALDIEVQTRFTICETGIHIKRSVAVHPEIAPTNLTPFSESLPICACKSWQVKFKMVQLYCLFSNYSFVKKERQEVPKVRGF